MVAATVETIYKIGDRVKLRKKPIAASHLNRGDVVIVAAVHPSDGSIKFWNGRSDRWECAHKDEIGRILDSVTPAEVAVTESTLASGNDDFLPLDPISIYQPRGTARGGPKYYRMSYKCGGKVRHTHIRGGNTDSPIAQAKVQEVRSLLNAGISPQEIAATLKAAAKQASKLS